MRHGTLEAQLARKKSASEDRTIDTGKDRPQDRVPSPLRRLE